MRKLIVLALLMGFLYGTYWFVGRAQIQDRLTQALIEADEGAYDISYDSLKTRGFPSRFDTTVTNFHFSDPATDTQWTAPVFQLLALSYRPNEVIAIFPSEQVFTVNDAEVTLLTDDMRASGKVRTNAALSFRDATITMENPRFLTPDGAQLTMAHVLAAMRLTPDTNQSYDIFLEAITVSLPNDIRRFIDPGNLQPEFFQSLSFDSVATFSDPIALNNASDQQPTLETLTIKEFAMAWGEISVSVIGDITFNDSGLPDGSISLSARNWQQALDLAVANGMVDDNRRFLVTEIISNLDETPHIQDTLTLTIAVNNGALSLGGLPLGTLPNFR